MRERNKLTAKTVSSLLGAGTKPGRYGDGGNLYLSVGHGGARRWVFVYKVGGKPRELGLGSARDVSLKKARELAAELREEKALGRDPKAVRTAARDIPLFGKFALEMVSTWETSWKNPKHRQQWRNTLTNDARALAGVRLDQIEIEHVLSVLRPIWQEKPETAKRLQGRIEKVLDAAIAHKHRTAPNPAAWKGNLEALLPRPDKLRRGHHPALPYAELPKFYSALCKRDGLAALALRFLLLTSARSGEVRGARWREIDFDAELWVVPASRYKTGKEHRVPLTKAALEVLDAVAPLTNREPDAVIFPNARGGELTSAGLTAVLRRMRIPQERASVHGFRSSFRDWAGNETEFPREIAEMSLGHKVGDEVERAYRREDALGRRRKVMDAWSKYASSGRGA